MKEKLTAGRIADFQCDNELKPSFLWDTEAKGLGVKASPGGAKQFVLEARLYSKSLRITIGDVRTWALDGPAGTKENARAEARRLLSLIDQGIDPRQLERDRIAATEADRVAEEASKQALEQETARLAVTMREAWNNYIEAMRDAKKDGKPVWCAQYLKDHQYVIAGKNTPAPLASLADVRLVELTPDRIADWLQCEASKRPTSANVAFRKLRAFIGWCADQKAYAGIISANACTTKGVTNALPKQRAKVDSLQREQLPLWFAEVSKLPLVVSAYLRTLLLTGARREELATLTWDNVDFKWNSLTIKDKVEGQRIIPLTPYVSQLLAELKCHNETPKVKRLKGQKENGEWKPSPWVFFSPTAKSGRIEGPHVAHQKALTAAGLPHISIHGLRRSFKSLAEWVEMPVGVVAQVMGHKQSATAEKHYTVRPLDLLRLWHSRYEAWILEQATVTFAPAPANLRVVA